MEYKKRNGFFVFCFSFIPGAVEMYMGFMKNGVSLFTLFVLASIGLMLDVPFISLFAAGSIAIIWIYAFFHAWNMYRLNGDVLMGMEDRYIWTEFGLPGKVKIQDEKFRRVLAIVFIFGGASVLWENVYVCVREFVSSEIWNSFAPILRNVPQTIISIIFIYFGIRLIKGKKKELGIDDNSVDVPEGSN
ncbi:hypothetical protein [Butyrivibrio sp. LB2008]|uniref:hypothetical protein n=1 Tax=Butyrivibrio sp. LB2008 TaxID=1408305 RepID=UPI00047D2B2E|nr:hypothetical protein [Butyrivibrio sp. LB2008]